jgi:DNA processing protein
LNEVYPKSHHSLIEEMVAKGGAVISEFPLAAKPHVAHFPRRNRIIAGLSLGTVVVEAALKSGSLITARHAMEQGREVFAIPGSIHHPLSRGCHYLIREGAKLVESIDDIVEELPVLRKASASKQGMPQEPSQTKLDPLSQKILDQIDDILTPLDAILCKSGLTATEVSSILLLLELNGYIQSVPGGYIRLQSYQGFVN